MGCDYYTQLETVIEYTNKDGNINSYKSRNEEDLERHYFYYDSSNIDTDFEDTPTYSPMVQEMNDRCEYYGVKVLFEDGTWKCKDLGRKRIENLCSGKGIDMESVVHVYKHMVGWLR
jgi:hypothetical protein